MRNQLARSIEKLTANAPLRLQWTLYHFLRTLASKNANLLYDNKTLSTSIEAGR